MDKQVTIQKRSTYLPRLRGGTAAAVGLGAVMLLSPQVLTQTVTAGRIDVSGETDGRTSRWNMRIACDSSFLAGKDLKLVWADTPLHKYAGFVKFPEVVDGTSNPIFFAKQDEALIGSAETKINCRDSAGIAENAATIIASINVLGNGDVEITLKNLQDSKPLSAVGSDTAKFLCQPGRGRCDGFIHGTPSGKRGVYNVNKNMLTNIENNWNVYRIRNDTAQIR